MECLFYYMLQQQTRSGKIKTNKTAQILVKTQDFL